MKCPCYPRMGCRHSVEERDAISRSKNSCILAKNSYFELIFSPKYSQRVLFSNEVSYDGIQIIFQKVDFFGVAGVGPPASPATPATFSKFVPQHSRKYRKKTRAKNVFFTVFYAHLYPSGLIPPPPNMNRVKHHFSLKFSKI